MIKPFDSADWLKDEEAINLYLQTTREFNDPELMQHAMGVARRARERNARRSGERVNAPA